MNFWALLSLVPGISYLLLAGYVLFKGRRESLSIVFTLFALSLAIWGLFEFGHRLTVDPKIANFCIKGGGFGWCVMASFWLHFVLIFARKEVLYKSKLTYMILYGPPLVILYLFLKTDLIYEQEPVRVYFGYTALPGRLIWTYTLYYTLSYVFATYLLLEIVRKGITLERKQAKPILVGATTFLLLGTATNVIFPRLFASAPELGTTLSMVWGISVFYAVIKHKLFIVKPSLESSMELPEIYSLEKGLGYLIEEERPDKGYEIFYDQITHGGFGLCVSKLAPEKVRERYKLMRTPILWLTFKNAENSISPKDMDGLTSTVSDFARKTEKSVFFFDCFDQIRFANGFESALSMLSDFIKLCSDNGSIMLISTDSSMFEKEQLAAIEKELEKVKRK